MSKSIEQIKHESVILGLQNHIRDLINEITNRTWNNVFGYDHFVKLNFSIDKTENVLEEMKKTLQALKEIDDRNT